MFTLYDAVYERVTSGSLEFPCYHALLDDRAPCFTSFVSGSRTPFLVQ